DYASPFAGPLEKRFIARHRLSNDRPIIYYVDHGAPEPIRSALLEGASWWKDAFAKAGWPNAFDVRILPEDADPMDIRYNVINWVHRSTRGWSYGAAVVDPRTGEIIKGNVSLGSLRIRQDVMLGSGMIAPYEGPNPEVLATLDESTSPTQLALARIRQLSAHEVGHTLGIAHNMAASTYDRASVMDYPAPNILIRNGKLDFSDAYDEGIGEFDVFAVRYGYSEGVDLNTIVREAVAGGMLFVADEHSRDPGAAHPLGSVWDNGSDPIAMLRHEMEVRRIALESFGVANLRPGAPLAELESILLPLYLHHRYQLEAALKSLGGAFFTYAVREGATTDIVPATIREIVPPSRQREALRAAMDTLEPSFLAIPQRIIDLIPPPMTESGDGIAERFDRSTAPLFDPIAAARSSAAITLNALLHPDRAARLVRFHAEDSRNPSLAEVTGAVVDYATADTRNATLRNAVRWVAVSRLIDVAATPATDPAVRAQYENALRELAARLRSSNDADARAVVSTIQRFLERGIAPVANPVLPAIPPGPPI
ncbi:MAG TPA: zinc-dependent metalloprotease, partial [Thermoanaerobaculia bacterium]